MRYLNIAIRAEIVFIDNGDDDLLIRCSTDELLMGCCSDEFLMECGIVELLMSCNQTLNFLAHWKNINPQTLSK